ncbi:unnamed protein product [Effrenium voratum]|uniref:Uncharacterized protein n=1 Tax=Effrenium voratum TaxID=2562239 RepID=A0AA36HVR3_9DINO|nr:unnamed protein product [Effrenium voratum]CAJ1446597.1 unnamed protein product [Effrenium voratum]
MRHKIIDVDWNKQHQCGLEWEHRQQQRHLHRLEEYHRSNAKPWVKLGESKADAAITGRLRSAQPEQVLSRCASGASSSRASERGLPRTPSTSLSAIWQRALATPSCSSRSGSSGERAMERLQASEAWQSACEKLGREELLDLVGHVHAQILDERRKRKEVQKQLQDPGS